MRECPNMLQSIMSYETPKVVTVHNPQIGLLRRVLQVLVVMYVAVYQLWYAKGYQEFASIESSVTTKVKGYSQSTLQDVLKMHNLKSSNIKDLYDRVWDEADYVVPPAENGAFFVTTNVVITPNQTWGHCPEDPVSVPESVCVVDDKETNFSQSCNNDNYDSNKSHGPTTGRCILSDRPHLATAGVTVCEIQSWCPTEDDRLVKGSTEALISGSDNHTVFIKNSIRFSYFGDQYHRNNLINNTVCAYQLDNSDTWLCNIFRLGDMVTAAGGNYSTLAITGGVVAVHIQWRCNLDFDFHKHCLPEYHFRILDSFGWNFRHAHFHEEGRRTLYKAFGIKFVIIVQGRAGKFDLKNTVINIVAGLGLLSFITMFCDFVLLNYVKERKIVKQKKYEVLEKKSNFNGVVTIKTVTNSLSKANNNTYNQNGGLPYNNGSSLHNRGAKKKSRVTSELVSTAVNTMQYNYNDDFGDHLEIESPLSQQENMDGRSSSNNESSAENKYVYHNHSHDRGCIQSEISNETLPSLTLQLISQI